MPLTSAYCPAPAASALQSVAVTLVPLFASGSRPTLRRRSAARLDRVRERAGPAAVRGDREPCAVHALPVEVARPCVTGEEVQRVPVDGHLAGVVGALDVGD